MSDTFNTYGYSFQIKLLAALFKNKTFLQQVSDILDSNYFESESNKWIANTVIEYFTEYKSLPCENFIRDGCCAYKHKCKYIHDIRLETIQVNPDPLTAIGSADSDFGFTTTFFGADSDYR